MMGRRFGFCGLALFFALSSASAHPVPQAKHDRIFVVRLTPAAVVVDYRLEVDEWTVVRQDLPAVIDTAELGKLERPSDYYEAFTRYYAPILAENLLAKLDGKPLPLHCIKRGQSKSDSLVCEFVFEAKWDPAVGTRHEFELREGNYELEAGLLKLSLVGGPGVNLLKVVEPDEKLLTRPATELQPGDDERLRKVSARFELTGTPQSAAAPENETPASEGTHAWSLTALLDSTEGFWVLMGLATCFGAVHALTPGHGKTLVAAYLVGERGTIWHALFLGIVTTLTHTGAVILLAVFLPMLLPNYREGDVASGLGLIGGLLVAGLGLWLLLCRLSGRADHFHLGGHGHHHHHGGHHHHHGGVDHYHDEQGHTHPLPAAEKSVGWWGLVVLGISGGIIPCWDAILMLGMSARHLELALPLLLAFSAGLAGVLILIGMTVVSVKGFAASRWGEGGAMSRLIRALPVVSAAVVTIIGLYTCYDSVHARPPETHTQVRPNRER